MWVHRISGTTVLVLTIVLSLYGIRGHGWIIYLTKSDPHHFFGLLIFFAVTFIVAGGIVLRSRMERAQWNTEGILKMKQGHKVSLIYLSY